MLKKLNLKLIFIESAFLFFLITGVKRLYIATQADIYHALMRNDYHAVESLTDQTMGEILANPYRLMLGSFIVGILLIAIINWKYKTSILNTILTFVIIFPMYPLGVFHNGFIARLFNTFCYLFSKNSATAFFIGGVIILFGAFSLLRTSIIINKDSNQ